MIKEGKHKAERAKKTTTVGYENCDKILKKRRFVAVFHKTRRYKYKKGQQIRGKSL